MVNTTFRKQALGSFFWLFLLRKLPLAFLAGVKLIQLDDSGSITQMKFKWINQNPFRSMYFAAMQMGAEFATGSMLFQYKSEKTRFSMLLVSVHAEYHKKAIGTISYTCLQGKEVHEFISSLSQKTEGATIRLPVTAKDEANEIVANFEFVWSCRSN